MDQLKAEVVLERTRGVFMGILAADIAKDGIGVKPDKDEIKRLYDYIFDSVEIYYDIQLAKANEILSST